jgi:hypothetical protein
MNRGDLDPGNLSDGVPVRTAALAALPRRSALAGAACSVRIWSRFFTVLA